jgi:ribosomal protein L21E
VSGKAKKRQPKYKVGDRVRITCKHNSQGKVVPHRSGGRTGTIIHVVINDKERAAWAVIAFDDKLPLINMDNRHFFGKKTNWSLKNFNLDMLVKCPSDAAMTYKALTVVKNVIKFSHDTKGFHYFLADLEETLRQMSTWPPHGWIASPSAKNKRNE